MAALSRLVLRDLLYAVDTPSVIPINAQEGYIKGWLVAPPGYVCKLRLTVAEQDVPVFTNLARPDVARHHSNNPLFKYSGFVSHVPLQPEPAIARLTASSGDSAFVLAESIPVPQAASQPEHAPIVLSRPPLLSLLIPLEGTCPYLLMRSVASIHRQTYSHWRICLIGQQDGFFNELSKYFSNSEKVIWAADASRVEGEFVLSMQAGDELEPAALEEFAAVLATGVDLVYSDEAAIDFYGERRSEWRKPDFDAEAFQSWNLIGRGFAIRRGLDIHSLARQSPERIRHVARVLYKVRDADSAATDNANENGEPGLFPGSLRIRHARPEGTRLAILLRPQDGVFQKAALGPLVDAEWVRIYENFADDVAEELVLCINGPLESVNHAFFEELAGQAARQDCFAATGIALDCEGKILHSGLRSDAAGRLVDSFRGASYLDRNLPRELSVTRSVDGITPFFYATKRDHWRRVKEAPLILREAGLSVLVTPYAIATFDIINSDAMLEDDSAAKPPAETPAQIASERNYLRRELASTRETLAKLEASRCADLKRRIEELESEIQEQRRVQAELLTSLSWKITSPLRACLRLVRGR